MVNNIEIPYIISSRRKGDYGTVIANIDLASKILDWEPKYSIADMCKHGWNWKVKNPNGY